MSKYSKLPDATIKIKIEKLISSDITEDVKKEIESALNPFDRSVAEYLCIKVEKSIADGKKLLEEYRKIDSTKSKEITKKTEDDIEGEFSSDAKTAGISADDLKEINKEFTPIISPNEWNAMKNLMGVPLKDENEVPIYPDLKTQFMNGFPKYSLKMYKGIYYDNPKFSETWKFKFVNLNNGFSKEFESLNKCCYTCFRLSIDSETNNCIYESWWVVNSNDSMNAILDLNPEDPAFKLEEIPRESISTFAFEFMKSNNPKYLSESYVH